MKNSKSTFPQPNSLLYNFIAFFVRIFLALRTHTTYRLDEVRHIKGPAVIMVTHTSNLDFLTLAVGLLPLRPTFIMSNHFFVHPHIGNLLKPLHAIPKKMFCPDVNAVRQIIKAVKAGNVVVMFPEGRLSAYGHSVSLANGTAELIKKLGVDVYAVRIDGLYKTLPKWGKAGIRKGPVCIDGSLLWHGSELKELTVSDIEAGLATVMSHDDEQSFTGAEYKCKKPALGLHSILYKCPECGAEFKMKSDAATLHCRACGSSWELGTDYVLRRLKSQESNADSCDRIYSDSCSISSNEIHSKSGFNFTGINAWYEWEQNSIDLDAGLECDCILATPDESGIMDRNAGFGHISMNRDEIHYAGTCWDEPLEFTEKTSTIISFPVSVGDHFDIYSNRVLYNIIPQPNPDESVKWVQYLDKLAVTTAR